jgi:hypothetical protein
MLPAADLLSVHIGETMTLAKTIAIGATALGLAAGGALAGEGSFGMNDSGSPQETFILLEPVDVAYADVYGIDENRDGVIDGYLLLEESDTLA